MGNVSTKNSCARVRGSGSQFPQIRFCGERLFADQEFSVELTYSGKETESAILSGTPLVRLNRVESCQKSQNGTSWENMLICGDNLSVLKSLLINEKVCEKIALVYIDPPFSTNQHYRTGKTRTATVSSSACDEIAYSDNLSGREYIEFLRRRLVLLKHVMGSDSSVYVHIDCKVGHYVKVIMDEVFGRSNFVNDITRIKCNPKNFSRKGYGNVKDMVLFYSKGSGYTWNGAFEAFTEEDVKRLFPKVDKLTGRRYTTTPLHAPGETRNGPTGQVWKGLRPPPGRHWRYGPEELTRLDEAGLIEWSGTGNPRKKIFADECKRKGKKRQDIWEFKDPCYPDYPTEKNLDMVQTIIEASSGPGDIVLDCFSGSGTTAIAAQRCGRRWIAIDESESAIASLRNRLLKEGRSTPFAIYRAESSR